MARVVYLHRSNATSELVQAAGEAKSSVIILQIKVARLRRHCVAVILIADINTQNTQWLTHSHKNIQIYQRLWDICRDIGLQQIIT